MMITAFGAEKDFRKGKTKNKKKKEKAWLSIFTVQLVRGAHESAFQLLTFQCGGSKDGDDDETQLVL